MFFKIAERKGKWKGMLSTFNMAERKGKAVQFRLDGTERKCFPKKMDRLTCMYMFFVDYASAVAIFYSIEF